MAFLTTLTRDVKISCKTYLPKPNRSRTASRGVQASSSRKAHQKVCGIGTGLGLIIPADRKPAMPVCAYVHDPIDARMRGRPIAVIRAL